MRKRIEGLVQKKVEGEQIAISPSAPETGAQVIDLMEALRASLDKASGKREPSKAVAAETPPTQIKAGQRKPAKEDRSRAGSRAANPPSGSAILAVQLTGDED